MHFTHATMCILLYYKASSPSRSSGTGLPSVPRSKRKQLLVSILPTSWPGFLHIILFFSRSLWLPEHQSSPVLWLTIIVGNSMVTKQCSDVKITSSHLSNRKTLSDLSLVFYFCLLWLSCHMNNLKHLLSYWSLHLQFYRTIYLFYKLDKGF